MNKDWSKIVQTTLPQYPLKGYGAISVLYNSEQEEELIVAGYASPQVIDREKHLITKEALAKDLPRFLANPKYRNAMLLHSNVQVGEVLPRWCHPTTGECWETKVDDIGLFSVIKVRTDEFRPPIVDQVIQDIKNGKIASFSISADAPFESRQYQCVDGACFWVISDIIFYEITLCETPVNQDANFTILSKSFAGLEDEFKLSSFCSDGTCAIPTPYLTKADKEALEFHKELSKADQMPGFQGGGVAQQAKPIEALEPKKAQDPRQPARVEGGQAEHAGGRAGANRNQIAKSDELMEDEDSPTGRVPGYADNQFDDDDYDVELRKTEYFVFSDLAAVLEKSIDELDLGIYEPHARHALANIQNNSSSILKGYSHLRNGSWVTWVDSPSSTLSKEFIDIGNLLDRISEKALDQGHSLVNESLLVKNSLSGTEPIRGVLAQDSFDGFYTKMLNLSDDLERVGLYVNKGYQVGWIGNAHRALQNAVESLRSHVIEKEEIRNSLSMETLVALDVLYEEMKSMSDNLGMGMALDKYQVQGDRPELDIISEVANSTVKDVKEADLLLEKVNMSEKDELDDADQQIHMEDHVMVKAENGDHSNDGMVCWYVPPEIAQHLAIPDGEPVDDLHLTLAYLPDISVVDPQTVVKAIGAALGGEPLSGKLSGVGRFSDDEKDVCYISADVPGLSELRNRIVESLKASGVALSENHGFTPHITLKYLEVNEPSPVDRLPPMEISIDVISLVLGEQRAKDFPLGGINKAIQNKTKKALQMNNTVTDLWDSKKPAGNEEKDLPHPQPLDTISQGTHNPIQVNRSLKSESDALLGKTMDVPLKVEANQTPVDQAAMPGKDIEVRQPADKEYDMRGAIKAGDEDARLTALMFSRLFHRALNDKRYSLCIRKVDNGTESYIPLD